MRSILRISLFLMGIVLIVMAIGGDMVRQKPSTAYWVLGEIKDGDDHSIYLSSPNGTVQRQIIAGRHANSAQLMEWLPDGRSFLYMWRSDQLVQAVYRYALNTQESTLVSRHYPSGSTSNTLVSPTLNQEYLYDIPQHDAKSIILRPDQEAIFALSNDGRSVSQLTPFHDSVLSNPLWSPDGEWFYYVARDIDDSPDNPNRSQPIALIRQRYDGTECTDLLRLGGDAQVTFRQTTPQSAFIALSSIYANPFEGESRIYHFSTSDSILSPITPDGGFYQVVPYDTDWLIIAQITMGAADDLYRISANGEDFALLQAIDPDHDIVQYIEPISATEYLVGITRQNYTYFYRYDLSTGQQRAIVDKPMYQSLLDMVLSDDKQALIFLGSTLQDSGRFRLDLATGETELLTPFQLTPLSYGSYYDNVTIASVSEYLLIMELLPLSASHQIGLYRLNTQTGESEQLLLAKSSGNFPRIYHLPASDGREIILSIDEINGGGQVKIDFVSGDVEWLGLGNNLKFSPFIDTDWGMEMILVGGIGLMVLGIGWALRPLSE